MTSFLFVSCGHDAAPIDKALLLRESLIASSGVSFHATITADYGDVLYSFALDCTEDSSQNLSFTVTHPETIQGITGVLSNNQSALTFDDKVLAFPPLSDGQLSPVIAPYLFMKALRGGYLSGCGEDGAGYCIYIDDTYNENPLKLQVFTDSEYIPIRTDIMYRNQRILAVDISDFTIL